MDTMFQYIKLILDFETKKICLLNVIKKQKENDNKITNKTFCKISAYVYCSTSDSSHTDDYNHYVQIVAPSCRTCDRLPLLT